MENKTNLCPECDLHKIENGKCVECGYIVPEEMFEEVVEVVTEVKPKKTKKVDDDV